MDIVNRRLCDGLNICSTLDSEIDEILGINAGTNIESKDILIMSGGGMKLPVQIGAIKALEELGMMKNFKTIVGTSSGAMIGLLASCGYTPKQLLNVCVKLGPDQMKSTKTKNIITDFGLDGGEKAKLIYEKMLEIKGFKANVTFMEHYMKTGIVLVLTGSCLNEKKCYKFSKDTTPDMPIVEALRTSMSLPFMFTPVELDGKLFVDGGCIENYPIKDYKHLRNRIVGIYLRGHYETTAIDHLEGYLTALFYTLMKGVDENCCSGYEDCTIEINCERHCDNGGYSLEMEPEEITDFHDIGYKKTMEYFSLLGKK